MTMMNMRRCPDLYKHLFAAHRFLTKLPAAIEVSIKAWYPKIVKFLACVAYETTSPE